MLCHLMSANFILMARAEADSLDDYMEDLQQGIVAKLPMICGNPDKVSVSLDGGLHICPGAVAEAYEQMGGEVVIFGKSPAASEFAASVNSISYEIITAISQRVKRNFKK